MTVKVTKPAINLREKLSELEANKNIDASALTTGTLPVDRVPYVGRRNLIINGGFDVWQRGISFSTSGGYGADRWWWSTADTISVNKTTFTEQQSALSIAKSTTVDPCYVAQSVEDVRTAAGKTVTLSFYAKANAATTLKVFGYQLFGSGGSSTVSIPVQSDSLTTDWTKYSFTFAIPSIEGKTIGTNSNLRMSIQFGSDNTWTGTGYLAQVQLELGSVATPFEHRSYGEELALCQRYYYPGGNRSIRVANNGGNWGYSGANYAIIHFPVTMRTIPTYTYSVSESNRGTADNIVISTDAIFATSQNFGSGEYWYTNNYKFDAEL